MSTLSENNLRINEIQTKITADSEKDSCPTESRERGPTPGDDSSNQDVGKSIQLDKAVQPPVVSTCYLILFSAESFLIRFCV